MISASEALARGKAEMASPNPQRYMWNLGDGGLVIDAQYYGNIARFFSHSCKPNVFPVRIHDCVYRFASGTVCFVTMEDVHAQTPLTIEYNFGVHKTLSLPCLCGHSDCRKDIFSHSY